VGHDRPATLKTLVAMELFFAFVGLMSGLTLLSSPSGEGLGLSQDLLEDTPVGDYMLVGLFFVVAYGILPSVTAYGLWTRRRWGWTDPLNSWTGHHWAWTASAALGILLMVWIGVEILLVGVLEGIGGTLQVIITLLGLAVLALTASPSLRRYMKSDG